MASAYDEIPYISFPYQQSHPDRLSAIARLLGIEAPKIETARILELGCAAGNNLIPMAENIPQGKFLGIDYSEPQVARGKKLIEELKLKNIEIRHASIMDIGHEEGLFDYIIAHGLFSWVPYEVQEKTLEICKKNLHPSGVAYVSYNVFPGWRMRSMVRDMMLYHTKRFASAPQQKMQQARAILEFMVQSVPQDNNPYGAFLKLELDRLRQQSDNYLYHEYMEENNSPCYFHEFVERANRYGLRYLGDSDMQTMSTHELHAEAKKLLAIDPDQIELEQYIDFLRNRMFRMTLLVHNNKTPVLQINARHVRNFLISATLQVKENAPELHSHEPETYIVPTGGEATARDPFVKAAIRVLSETWPKRIPFQRLLKLASSKLGIQAPADEASINRATDQIGSALLLFYTRLPMGAVELSLRSLGVVRSASEKPKVPALVRLQAAGDGILTNLRHQTIHISDFQKAVVPMLDGSRTKQDIVVALQNLVQKKQLQVYDSNIRVVNRENAKNILEKQLDHTLSLLAMNSLMIG
jgi:methyltransferase-like protein/2-polyprenyl-3-methyl-5-hydroxy-6-metoxy-1,4-benzoquinol methylase